MAKDIQLAVRMDEVLRDAIKAAAAADGRPMSGYMERAVVRALQQDGYLSDPAKPAAKSLPCKGA